MYLTKRTPMLLLPVLLGIGTIAQAAPNVILIMTDDQGYGDFGATGNELIETPHLDAMATRSVWMETFYVSPVCSPTRANLMTGRYNYRTRCIDTYLGRSMMEPDETTIAEMLRNAGYATGIFGKWHLGDTYPMRPIDQGFEEALVHRGGGLAQPADPPGNDRRYTDPILIRNGEPIQTTGYCTDVYFDAAQSWIETALAADRPFFAYIATNAPHGPYHDVPENWRKHYEDIDLTPLMRGRVNDAEIDKLQRIAAMISNVDENVGKLFDTLDRLGITNETLVIFLVDNGPNTARYVGPFRGNKSGVFEGGIRSPLWMHWPGTLVPHRRDEIAAHLDLTPTILEACGVAAPQHVSLDGRSFWGLATRTRTTWPERPLVIQTHRGDEPVRYHHFMIREGRWKLVHPSGFGRESFEGPPKFELYDVVADPSESNDLSAAKPEVVARLRSEYDAWFNDVSSTRPDNYAPPRIVIGTPHEHPTTLTRQDWRGGTWGRDSVGHWLIDIRDGTYDVTARFEPNDFAETLEVRIGETTGQVAVPAGTESVVLRSLTVPDGEAQIHATLTSGDAERGVHQLDVARQP